MISCNLAVLLLDVMLFLALKYTIFICIEVLGEKVHGKVEVEIDAFLV